MAEKLIIEESPLEMIEGEIITYNITWRGASTITKQDTVIYRTVGGVTTDITSAAMPNATGSDNNKDVQTLGALTAQANHGGTKYVVLVTATVNSNTEKRKLIIDIIDPASEV